jgi:hypothetical protein
MRILVMQPTRKCPHCGGSGKPEPENNWSVDYCVICHATGWIWTEFHLEESPVLRAARVLLNSGRMARWLPPRVRSKASGCGELDRRGSTFASDGAVLFGRKTIQLSAKLFSLKGDRPRLHRCLTRLGRNIASDSLTVVCAAMLCIFQPSCLT